MQIFDVKNDIAKILYDSSQNHLLPSDFLLIEDSNQKLIAQVINIEMTDETNNMAVLRLSLSIDKDDNLSYYNGYIPSKNSKVLYINPDEIVELISTGDTTLYLGNLSNHPECFVKTNISLLNDNLYIQSDRDDKVNIFIKNVITELLSKKRKVIIIDFNGQYSSLIDGYRLKITENMKLPLNIEAFDTLLEYEISDCPVEDKVTIQSIVLELREYMSTLQDKYIPFNMFKNVVDSEFLSSPSSGLMLLRNKLWEYSQEGLFADEKDQFDKINAVLAQYNTVVIDASTVDENWYKFVIKTVFDLTYQNAYLFVSLNDTGFDKKSISHLYSKENIVPVVSTTYDNPYASALKSLCKNLVMFKPSVVQNEQEIYTNFLNRVNNNEFMLYGETTLFLPLLIDLQLFDEETANDVVQNDIKKDVDKLLSSSQALIPKSGGIVNEIQSTETISDEEIISSTPNDDVTDEDYDFLEDIDETENEDDKTATVGKNKPGETNVSSNGNSSDKKADVSSGMQKDENNSLKKEIENTEKPKYSVFNPDDDNFATDDDIDAIMNQPFMTIEDVKLNAETIEEEKNIKGEYIDKFDVVKSVEDNENKVVEPEIILDDVVDLNIDETEDKNINREKVEIIPEDTSPVKQNSDDSVVYEENAEIGEIEITQNSDDDVEFFSDDVINDDDVTIVKDKSSDILTSVETKSENSLKVEDKTVEKNIGDENFDKDILSDDILFADEEINNNSEETKTIETKQKSENSKDDDLVVLFEDDNKDKTEKPLIKKNINPRANEHQKLTEYETDSSFERKEIPFKIGDKVFHPKHGKGVIVDFTNYSNKILFCRVDFENVGMRILDPRISGLEKV